MHAPGFDIVVFSEPLVKDVSTGNPLTAWFSKHRHILPAFFLPNGHIKSVISETWEWGFQDLLHFCQFQVEHSWGQVVLPYKFLMFTFMKVICHLSTFCLSFVRFICSFFDTDTFDNLKKPKGASVTVLQVTGDMNKINADRTSEGTTLERDNCILCIPSFNKLESTGGSFSNPLTYFSLW